MKNFNPITYLDYNLDGKYINVKMNNSFNSDIYKNEWLPCFVIGEYKKFIRVKVLPHKNKKEGMDTSYPYIICLNKMAIQLGEIKVKEY